MRYYVRGLCVLFFLMTGVKAQDSSIITIDTPSTLTVTSEQAAYAIYQTAADSQHVRIHADANDEDFDVVLWVIDAQSNVIAYNDNHSDSRQARVETLRLEANQSYRIYVDSFNGVSAGDVDLTVMDANIYQELITTDEATTTIHAHLPPDARYTYALELEANQQLSQVTARDLSGTLDLYLQIVDAQGDTLVSNDDHQSYSLTLNTFDSQIIDWRVPTTQTYTLQVHDFLGRSGQFELLIQIAP